MIDMPLLALRATTPRGGYVAMLGMGLLSAEPATLRGLVRILAMQGQISNAPTLAEALVRMATVGQALVLGAIAAIYDWVGKQAAARASRAPYRLHMN